MKIKLFVTIGITLLFFACKKYEEGPALTFRTAKARITGTWNLTSFHVNGIDSTSQMLSDSCYSSSFIIDSKPEKVIYKEGNCRGFIGYWSFTDSYKVLDVSSRFILRQAASGTRWEILRLTNNELWLQTVNYSFLYYATFKKVN